MDDLDAVVVGAGFSGLYALHRLRGLGLSTRVYEAAAGVGGTWYWNRYPGARCDVESLCYSYSFSEELEQEWEWTERYPAQPEILRYLEHVADRFDLRRDIQLETRVVRAAYDEDADRWTIETGNGERVRAQYLVLATGCLSTPQLPSIPGLDSFAGDTYHTGRWPHEPVGFAGKRVAVIGTGSSAIQSIPVIAREAAHVYVFQRTPNYSVPAHNRPLDPREQREAKAHYRELRERMRDSFAGFPHERSERSALDDPADMREQVLEERWRDGGIPFLGSYMDIGVDERANELVAEFVRAKIRATVRDPELAELLCPKDYPIGTKRICVDTAYFETFNRDNVTLVDLRRTPIVEIAPSGVHTVGGEYDVDAIVFATGFDAMTGTLLGIDLRGRGGRTLGEAWAHGPTSYLGLQVAGFPNLFTITGPGSPSVLSNMVVSIEQHVDWIADCVAWMRERGFDVIEATPEAEVAWVAHVNEVAAATLFPRTSSWYTGANVPGKPRVFMPYVGGVDVYRQHCAGVAARDYEGFRLARRRESAAVQV
jgi:cyclohexanone monooxygenase